MLTFVLLVLCVFNIGGVQRDDTCNKDGASGVCTELRKCTSAKQDIKNRKTPQICEFRGIEPVVCCFDNPIKNPRPVSAITKGPISPTEYVPPSDSKYDRFKKDACDPIPASKTANKTGRKAWDKCIEYQQLVYPCQESATLPTRSVRQNKCHRNSFALVGGRQAGRHEFTHAVLLGYGENLNKLDWLCGGALISDRFILTAAHCSISREWGTITYAALNPNDRAAVDPQKIFKVKSIIRHPEFKPPKSYHDIALLELEAPVPLDSYTVPACLPTSESESEGWRALATTWSTNDILGTNATWLQKIYLMKFSSEECSKMYPKSRKGGFNETTQVCYADRTGSKDICQDDGGNPLVVENSKLSCMYKIIGVTSYGKGCFGHSPGVYTKLGPYVEWIESVVWP